MNIWEGRLITGGLALAGLLFFVAALKPVINGRPLNVAFFLIGLVVLVLGVAGWRKFEGGGRPPRV